MSKTQGLNKALTVAIALILMLAMIPIINCYVECSCCNEDYDSGAKQKAPDGTTLEIILDPCACNAWDWTCCTDCITIYTNSTAFAGEAGDPLPDSGVEEFDGSWTYNTTTCKVTISGLDELKTYWFWVEYCYIENALWSALMRIIPLLYAVCAIGVVIAYIKFK